MVRRAFRSCAARNLAFEPTPTVEAGGVGPGCDDVTTPSSADAAQTLLDHCAAPEGPRSASAPRQQRVDHRPGLRVVPAAEEVRVVEHVIEVVQALSLIHI